MAKMIGDIITQAKNTICDIFETAWDWAVPLPDNIFCSYDVEGQYDGAGLRRNLMVETVRSKEAFNSQIKCEADIRIAFFKAIEKRLDVNIMKTQRHAFSGDHLQKILPEFTEQDLFDSWRIFLMLQRDPGDLLTSRAEIILNLSLLGHVGPLDDFLEIYRPDLDSDFLDTSYEGMDFEEFIYGFYHSVVVPQATTGELSALGKTLKDLLHETKIRRNMSPIQRILVRMS